MKSTWPIFKSEMLTFQSEANVDMKILFGRKTHPLDPVIRKFLVKVFLWDREYHFRL